MTINKRSKVSRRRGSWTHGWGSKKKHRGAGHRGGRGNAGSGKRGDANKSSIWKNKKYFGKYGFTSKSRTEEIKSINTYDLDNNIDKFINEKKAEFKDGLYIIDLSKVGYNKLLCKGIVKKKFDITVWKASKSVKGKIEGAGGKINILEQPSEKGGEPVKDQGSSKPQKQEVSDKTE